VRVQADLSIPGDPDIFVIGDAALVTLPGGGCVPGVAPAAKQQGRYVASAIAARIAGKTEARPFVYKNPGNLATIGRKRAVIELPFLTLRGWLAWWLWGVTHIFFLVGVPSAVLVSLRWLWEYATYGRGARLITGAEHAD
jgi:NADH dehydrogenase